VADSVLEVGDGDDWGREKQPPRIFRVIAVEAEQGMEVDRAAGLVFGGFAVGYAYRLNHAAAAGELDEVSFDRLLGAPPQLTCLVVPDHVGPVVIAVRAERLAEPGVVAEMTGEAERGPAVLAGGGVAAGAARLGPARAAGPVGAGVPADRAGVDRAERGSGQGDKHGRVGSDGRIHAFAADQPGADDVVGIATVGLGTAGADRGTTVAARLIDSPVRHADRRDGTQQLASAGIDVLDVATQLDGATAGGGGPDVIEPGVVSGVVQVGEHSFVGGLRAEDADPA
jgi:hypothetical protein